MKEKEIRTKILLRVSANRSLNYGALNLSHKKSLFELVELVLCMSYSGPINSLIIPIISLKLLSECPSAFLNHLGSLNL